MAHTINYNKICDKCNGKPYVWGWKKGFIFYIPYIVSKCDKCELGILKPKQVIHHLDRFEPTIIY